jgi:Bacteriophage probable baseplate hub protein
VPRLPDFSVRVNGANLPREALADVRALTVDEDLDALSMFSLELYNWDDEHLRVSWSDSRQFAIGNEVEIWLGWVDDLHKVMLAEVTSLEPVFSTDQPPMLTVRGYDHRHRLARGRRTRTFSQIKDSAIAAQVAREAGLRAQVGDTRITLGFVVQSNQTDWEFLRQRAGRIGYELHVRDKTLYFQPPGHGGQASVRLALGEDVTEFTPRLSALGQESRVAVSGWDVRQKQAIVGTAGVGQEPRMGRTSGPAAASRAFGRTVTGIVDQPVRSRAEADQLASGRFNELALAYVKGSVTCLGQPQLRAGMVVQLDGAGQTFSGPYYVTSVTHTLSQHQGYRTSLTVERNGS